jgi:hypothetical protein
MALARDEGMILRCEGVLQCLIAFPVDIFSASTGAGAGTPNEMAFGTQMRGRVKSD